MAANVKPFVSVNCSLILKLLVFHGCYPAGGVLLAKSVADDSYILSIMGADLLPYFSYLIPFSCEFYYYEM